MSKKRLIIIDGSNLAYRALFVNGNLINGTIYGSFNIIKNIMNQFQSCAYSIVWDAGGETERHRKVIQYIDKGIVTSKYKDRKHDGLEEFYKHVEIIKKNMNLINVNSFEKRSVEADDIIGSLCKKHQNDYNILIISSDKDFYQLINENTSLYRPVSKEMYDVKTFNDKFGIDPYLMLHVGALTGDNGDNIEGINGIGEKTAISIIKKYGTLHKFLKSEEARNDKSKKIRSIFENEEKLKLAYFLKKINQNIDMNLDIKKFTGIKPELKDFFKKMDFNSFLDNYALWEGLK